MELIDDLAEIYIQRGDLKVMFVDEHGYHTRHGELSIRSGFDLEQWLFIEGIDR